MLYYLDHRLFHKKINKLEFYGFILRIQLSSNRERTLSKVKLSLTSIQQETGKLNGDQTVVHSFQRNHLWEIGHVIWVSREIKAQVTMVHVKHLLSDQASGLDRTLITVGSECT